MSYEAMNFGKKFQLFDEQWQPKVVAEMNDYQFKIVRLNWDHAPRHLIRDRDTSYGPVFLQRIRAMGIRDHPIAPRSPWQNAYVERLIGSIRRECLDHMIVFGEAHLRRILRGHRSLNKDAPLHRAVERLGAVVSRPVLGGLHHQYCRI
jgi:transposase InsO family protein